MPDSRKPLHSYEQSMLLVAMLFDSKNLNEIVNFLTDQQRERIRAANEKFLKLPRNERMTQIVFELRRLLLIDEHRVEWIHQTWIDDALSKEPPYLRAIIHQAIDHGSQKKSANVTTSFVPLPLIFSMFIDQLINTPQKTAIYDPVLMQLQSLKDEAQEEVFAMVGRTTLQCLSSRMNEARWKRFLAKKSILLQVSPAIAIEKNPFDHAELRSRYVQSLMRFKPIAQLDGELFAGLMTTALYLSGFKHHWQRTIALGLHRRLGLLVEQMIRESSTLTIDKNLQGSLSALMIMSLEQVTIG